MRIHQRRQPVHNPKSTTNTRHQKHFRHTLGPNSGLRPKKKRANGIRSRAGPRTAPSRARNLQPWLPVTTVRGDLLAGAGSRERAGQQNGLRGAGPIERLARLCLLDRMLAAAVPTGGSRHSFFPLRGICCWALYKASKAARPQSIAIAACPGRYEARPNDHLSVTKHPTTHIILENTCLDPERARRHGRPSARPGEQANQQTPPPPQPHEAPRGTAITQRQTHDTHGLARRRPAHTAGLAASTDVHAATTATSAPATATAAAAAPARKHAPATAAARHRARPRPRTLRRAARRASPRSSTAVLDVDARPRRGSSTTPSAEGKGIAAALRARSTASTGGRVAAAVAAGEPGELAHLRAQRRPTGRPAAGRAGDDRIPAALEAGSRAVVDAGVGVGDVRWSRAALRRSGEGAARADCGTGGGGGVRAAGASRRPGTPTSTGRPDAAELRVVRRRGAGRGGASSGCGSCRWSAGGARAVAAGKRRGAAVAVAR